MLGLVLGVYTFAWSGESKLVWTLGPNRVQGQSIIKKNKQRLLYRKALKWISWKTRVDENAYGDTEFGHNLQTNFRLFWRSWIRFQLLSVLVGRRHRISIGVTSRTSSRFGSFNTEFLIGLHHVWFALQRCLHISDLALQL